MEILSLLFKWMQQRYSIDLVFSRTAVWYSVAFKIELFLTNLMTSHNIWVCEFPVVNNCRGAAELPWVSKFQTGTSSLFMQHDKYK